MFHTADHLFYGTKRISRFEQGTIIKQKGWRFIPSLFLWYIPYHIISRKTSRVSESTSISINGTARAIHRISFHHKPGRITKRNKMGF